MKKVTKLIIVGMALCTSAFIMSCANSAGGYAVGSDEYNAAAAAAAAAAATTGTGSGSGASANTAAVTVSATWDAADGVTYSAGGTLTGTNATWTWATGGATMSPKDSYIVSIGKGSSNKNVATLKVDGACTVTVTFRYGGDYAADKIRDLDVGGKNLPMTSATDKTKDYTVSYTAAAAGNIAVKGNGVNIKKIVVQ